VSTNDQMFLRMANQKAISCVLFVESCPYSLSLPCECGGGWRWHWSAGLGKDPKVANEGHYLQLHKPTNSSHIQLCQIHCLIYSISFFKCHHQRVMSNSRDFWH